jgi:hypothetical protein
LLTGVAGIVQHPGSKTVYWVHLAGVAAISFRAIFWWWLALRLSDTQQRTLPARLPRNQFRNRTVKRGIDPVAWVCGEAAWARA